MENWVAVIAKPACPANRFNLPENRTPSTLITRPGKSCYERGVPAGTVAILLGNAEQIVVPHYSARIESWQKPLDDAVEKANIGSAD